MRLHSLDIQAFGPFGDTASVDFDVLGEAGLFLFTGNTGSGKSSVLDAVCFALYGVVPGARQAARQLRSDHADPGVPPEVTLEFSVDARRFRIRRSPAWQRPKRRGEGTTTQQASVVMEELQPDGWTALTTRLDDAGDLVIRLLGMQSGQFTQVAMLPQGEFQKFLGARTDERQAILQRLFDTDRFGRIEQWLRDRATDLRRAVTGHSESLRDVLNRIEEVSGCGVPDHWQDLPVALQLSEGEHRAWCGDVVARCERDAEEAAGETSARAGEVTRLQTEHDQALEIVRRQTSGTAARTELVRADAEAADVDRAQGQLAAHTRAQPVLAVDRQRPALQARLTDTDQGLMRLLGKVGASPDISCAELGDRVDSTRRRLHALEEFLPRQRQLEQAQARRVEVTDDIEGAAASLSDLDARLAALPDQRRAAEERLRVATAAAGQLAGLAAAVTASERAHAGALELLDVTARAEVAREEVLAATATHQALRERYQDLREQRIDAMAGELAAGLAAGCSCPVCGSASHPSPASAAQGVGREAEDAARAAVDDAAIELEARRDRARTLEHDVATLEAVTQGLGAEAWAVRLQEDRAAHETAARDAATVQDLEAGLSRMADEADAMLREQAGAGQRLASLRTRRDALDEEISLLEAEADRLLRDAPHARPASVGEALEAHRSLVALLDDAHTAMQARDRLRSDLAALEETVTREAVAAGFASADEARAAILEDETAAGLSARVTGHAEAVARARAVLADADITAALEIEAPDVSGLEVALGEARDRFDDARTRHQLVASRLARLGELSARLDHVVDAAGPAFEEHDLVSGLADLLEGRVADTALRMRLSAYVLGERLRSVVDAANDQLGRMGLERFTLEQSDTGSGRDRRGGLGLRIRDTWTSTVRETGTLSGGESFMVSLALALGLADTVTAESGGVQIETLFVDEGFGSLDSEALEGVLDTLDALREGGRAVGVVSHVTEMRERIPTQIRVSARPDGGSRLQVVLGE